MQEPLIETFNIPITEWKTVDIGKNTIRIKGVALKGDAISKNNRKYVAKELKKATNTWINKPVNINHDNTKKAGHITWMDYDETTELLTYEAEITRDPYVTMLRNHSTEIRGVSIQADYLFNRCAKCNKKFYAEEDWHNHMAQEHFIHDLPSQPHGIIGNALSLVLSPEIPGYGGTSVELAEMARLQFSRLCEIITKVETEKEEYYLSNKIGDKAAVRNTSRMAFGSKPYLTEVQECPEGEVWDEAEQKCVVKPSSASEQEMHECPEGEVWSEEEQKCIVKPVATEQEEHECPEGEVWDAEAQKCVAKPAATSEQAHECPEGEVWSVEQDKCVVWPAVAEVECPEGEMWDGEKCVPKPPEPTMESLKLGEPFADYTDFADCVAKNSDKEDPEAYCGSIKSEAEETKQLGKVTLTELSLNKPKTVTLRESKTLKKIIYEEEQPTPFEQCIKDGGTPEECALKFKETMKRNNTNKAITNTVNEIIDVVSKQITVDLPVIDESWKPQLKQVAEQLNKLTVAVNGWKDNVSWKVHEKELSESMVKLQEYVLKLPKTMPPMYDDRTVREMIRVVKPYNDKALREMIRAIKPYNDKTIKEQLANIKPYDDKAIKETLTEYSKFLTETFPKYTQACNEASVKTVSKEELTKLSEIVTKQKVEFDTLLKVADDNTGKLQEQLTEKIKELEEIKQKLKESDVKKLEETQSLNTRVENLEDRVKPQFKARTLASKEAENKTQDYAEDPNKKVKN